MVTLLHYPVFLLNPQENADPQNLFWFPSYNNVLLFAFVLWATELNKW